MCIRDRKKGDRKSRCTLKCVTQVKRQPAGVANQLATLKLRSNMFAPLYPSDHHLPWQRQMRNVKSSSLVISRQCVTPFNQRGCAWCSTVTMPFVRDRKWKKKWVCLSAASFAHFPFFVPHKRGPRRGSGAVVAFLCLLSLAKQRK